MLTRLRLTGWRFIVILGLITTTKTPKQRSVVPEKNRVGAGKAAQKLERSPPKMLDLLESSKDMFSNRDE